MFAPEKKKHSRINKERTQTQSVPVCVSVSAALSSRCVTAGRVQTGVKVYGVSCLSESRRARRTISTA